MIHENISSIAWLIATAAVWGVSTPFIKRGCKGIENVQRHSNVFVQWFYEFKYMLTNYKFTLPFLINQSGSLLYVIALGFNDLSIAVPVTNALNFVFVLITGIILGEEKLNKWSFIGTFLVIFGVILCIMNDLNK